MERSGLSTNNVGTLGNLPAPGDVALLRLLRLFPHATGMDVAVQVALPNRPKGQREKTRVCFGTGDTALFRLHNPLPCESTVYLRSNGGAHEIPAKVVAMMSDEGGVAVAVRFLEGPPDWLPKT